jgi:hypothetical protein
MDVKRVLVLSAVAGMFLGSTACGGGTPPPADPSAPGAAPAASGKASCSGAEHTDKNHCSASGGATPAPK